MSNNINLADMLNQYAAAGSPACDSCDADQQILTDPDCPQIVHLNVMHDDDCPVLERHTAKGSRHE